MEYYTKCYNRSMIQTRSLQAGAHTIVGTTEIGSSNDTSVIRTAKLFIISVKPSDPYAGHSSPMHANVRVTLDLNKQETLRRWYWVVNISFCVFFSIFQNHKCHRKNLYISSFENKSKYKNNNGVSAIQVQQLLARDEFQLPPLGNESVSSLLQFCHL